MSNIYEIIDSLNLGEAETHKIQINLINNPEKEERLLFALTNKNNDAKTRFLESFLETIPVLKRSLEEITEVKKKVRLLENELYKTKFTVTVSHEVGKNVLNTASPTLNEIFSFLKSETPISLDSLDTTSLPQYCKNEDEVQKKFIKFFNSLKGRIKCNIIDTSTSNWLKDPIGKIDISIVDGSQVLWAHLISGIEIKQSLKNTTLYHEAIGQLVDRFQTVFRMQRGRRFIIGAVCCDNLIEFIYANSELKLKRSGLLELSFTKQTTGMQMLLNMLSSNQHQLGYSPPKDHEALVGTSGFTYENVLRQADNGRGSLVFSGFINSKKAVLKASMDLNNELKMLEILKDCEYIPQVINKGLLSDGRMFIVTTPAGVHLEAKKHGVKGTLKALRDVMKALKFSHEHHIYHRDVSYLNIVYKNQRGYLIDWGVASNTSDLVNAPLTGTYLFSSLPVLNCFESGVPHTYSVNDEIESLFYVFMYIACDGIVRWRKHSDLSTSVAIKYNVMICPFEFGRHLVKYAYGEFHEYLLKFRDIIFPYGSDLEKRNISIDEIIEIFGDWINELE
ncbi:unnamed protein product [Rhizophagus irregularis]|nr:unnamed protein product [Rhizophagus irregularis]